MASHPPRVSLESLDEQHQGLRVEFRWHKDRYVHTIYHVTPAATIPLCASVEDTEDELYPASPCLVDLHQQQQILFLTGATSTCHWSLSIQAIQVRSLMFEVACRLKATPLWLGSKYEILDPSAQKILHSPSMLRSRPQEISISPAAELILEFPTTLQWNYVVRA